MLVSDIIAIEYQDIKYVDSTDFSLSFPLQKGIDLPLRLQSVAISVLVYSPFVVFWVFFFLPVYHYFLARE